MTPRIALVAMLGLTGCLSKPENPFGLDEVASPPACTGSARPLASNLQLTGPPQVLKLDANAAEDLLLFGTVDDVSHAYIIYGRAPIDLTCADFDLQFDTPDFKILTTWTGDLDTDSWFDFALLGRSGNDYKVAFYRGRTGGGFEPPSYGFMSGTTYTADWTGAADVFMAEVDGELFVGGSAPPFATFSLDNNSELAPAHRVVQASDDGALPVSDIAGIWGAFDNPGTTGEEATVLVGSTSHVTSFVHTMSFPEISKFNIADPPGKLVLSANQPRSFRAYHRPTPDFQTVAVTQAAQGYDVLQYSATNGVRISTITGGADFGASYLNIDETFGETDETLYESSPDLVTLTGIPGGVHSLNVHRSLDFSAPDGSVDRNTAMQTTDVSTNARYVVVADWDGLLTTPDDILVLDVAPGSGRIGACFHLVDNMCVRPCSVSVCAN